MANVFITFQINLNSGQCIQMCGSGWNIKSIISLFQEKTQNKFEK